MQPMPGGNGHLPGWVKID